MAQSDIEINVEATGVSAYERDMQRASRATSQATGSMSSALKGLAGAVAGAFGARAIWDFTKQSVGAFATFEQGLADLRSITGATDTQMKYFAESAKEMGIEVEGGATAVSRAFSLIGSAKPELLEDAKALAAVTKEAIVLSQASGLQLPEAATALTDALNQFKAPASEASKYINILGAAAKFGSAEIPQTTEALLQFGVVAKAANISIEQSGAAIEILAAQGLKGSVAGEKLKNIFLTLSAAKGLPQEALDSFKEVGVDVDLISNKSIPLQKRLEELGKVFNSQTAPIKVFGKENIAAAEILFKSLPAFEGMTKSVSGTSTAYEQAAIRTATLSHSFTELQNRVGAVMLEFGESLKPVIDDIIAGFVPAMASIREAFKTITSTFRPFFEAIGELGAAFGFARGEGSVFASIISGLAKHFTILSIPARTFWGLVTGITNAFADVVAGMKEFQANSPVLAGIVNTLLGPFTLLGDAISWVGEALGFGAEKIDASKASYNGVVSNLASFAKSMGATAEQTRDFAQTFDMASIAGLSYADAIRKITADFKAFKDAGREAFTKVAAPEFKKSIADIGGEAKAAFGSIDYLNDRLSALKKQFSATSSEAERSGLALKISEVERVIKGMVGDLDPAKAALGGLASKFGGLAMAAGTAKNELAEVLAMSDAAGQPDFSSGLVIAEKRLAERAAAIKDIFKTLSEGIKSMAIDMGYTISEAIGYAITAGGGFGDAIKGVLREMAVQIPKMAGMALLNAATFPGNSPIALPLAVAGAALLGLSGILSGVFKGMDAKKQQEQSAANNAGASSVPRAAQSGLAAFQDNQQNVGQQMVDALNGTRLVLQVGDQSMDAYVKGANKRNATRQGK